MEGEASKAARTPAVRVPPLALNRLPGHSRPTPSKAKQPPVTPAANMAWPTIFGDVSATPQKHQGQMPPQSSSQKSSQPPSQPASQPLSQPPPQPPSQPHSHPGRVVSVIPRAVTAAPSPAAISVMPPASVKPPAAAPSPAAHSAMPPAIAVPSPVALLVGVQSCSSPTKCSSPKRFGRRSHPYGSKASGGSFGGRNSPAFGGRSSPAPAFVPDAPGSHVGRAAPQSTPQSFKHQLKEAEDAAKKKGRSFDFLAKLELVEQLEREEATLRQSSTPARFPANGRSL